MYSSNGDGYGASIEWDATDDLALIGAWTDSARTSRQNALALGEGKHAQIWGVGFKYSPGKYYLATKYSQGLNITPISGYGYANKTKNYEIYTQYTFTNGFVPSLGYFYSKGEDLESYGDRVLLKYIDASLRYYFNKNMSVYGDYRINLLDKKTPFNILTDDTFGLGITYQF